MPSRDLIINQIENISLVIAKLIGLKKKGNTEEFVQLYNNSLLNEYNFSSEKLLDLSNDDFKLILESKNYSANKLDALAKLIYLNTELSKITPENTAMLQKVIILFDLLEQKHHQQSFENINTRKLIYQYLNHS